MIKQESDLTSHLFTRQIIYLSIELIDILIKKKKKKVKVIYLPIE